MVRFSVRKKRKCGSKGKSKMLSTGHLRKCSSKSYSVSKKRKRLKHCLGQRLQALPLQGNYTKSSENGAQAQSTRGYISRIRGRKVEVEQPVLRLTNLEPDQLLRAHRSQALSNDFQDKETKCSVSSSGMGEDIFLLS